MERQKIETEGHLDIFIIDNQDEFEGKIEYWKQVLIYGNPQGLKSFANLLSQLADIDQKLIDDLPNGDSEHFHLRPNLELSKSSVEVIIGRLDAKGDGTLKSRYVAKGNNK